MIKRLICRLIYWIGCLSIYRMFLISTLQMRLYIFNWLVCLWGSFNFIADKLDTIKTHCRLDKLIVSFNLSALKLMSPIKQFKGQKYKVSFACIIKTPILMVDGFCDFGLVFYVFMCDIICSERCL